MRFNIFAALAIFCGLLVTGCGKPADKIVGKWKVDLAALENDPNLAKLEGEAKKTALEAAKKMMGSMTTEFTKDGKVIMNFGAMKMEGTYTVKSTDGNTVTLETTMKKGDKEKKEEIKVTVDGGKIKLKGPDGKEIAFVK